MSYICGIEKPPLDEDLLEHYGVKGMKWGVRKDRLVGRVRKARKERKSKPSARRVKLESKHISKGRSLEEARRKADNRIKTEKILAVVGATAVVGLAAYAGHKEIGKRFSEVVLDEGTEMKYVNALGKKVDLDRRLYTTFEESDTKKYRGMLAKAMQQNSGRQSKIYETTLRSTEQIKAPSHNQAKKLYDEWNKRRGHIGKAKDYKQFNLELVVDDGSHDFFKFMKEKGFNAVLDSNDQFISGYNTKKPLILFNAASSTVKAGEKVIEQSTIDGLYKKQVAAVVAKELAPTVGLGVAAVGGGRALDTRNRYKVVNQYILEHPNTKLTPSEIYANLEQDKRGNYKVKG